MVLKGLALEHHHFGRFDVFNNSFLLGEGVVVLKALAFDHVLFGLVRWS